MGDSEDEYDRKRRDKFRGERTESYPRGEGRRGGGGEDRRREEWIERESWGSRNRPRTDYREYRGGSGRERYSPARTHDISPPMKRVRTEWEDRRGAAGYSHEGAAGSSYGNYGGSWGHENYNSQHAYGNHTNSQSRDLQGMDTQPPMMSFKAFLQTQDDNITDDEAIKKYNEYKLEFKRQQLNEFFVAHKEEEWFKIKYHPEDSVKRKDEQMNALKSRVKVFLEFLETNRLDKVSVDADQSEGLIRLLDAVVIRLEGGTDFDLQVLDEPKPTPPPPSSESGTPAPKTPNGAEAGTEKPATEEAETPAESVKEEDDEEEEEESEAKPFILGEEEEKKKPPAEPEVKKDPSQPLKLTISSEQMELQKKAKEFLKQKSGEDEEASPAPPPQGKKRKREYEYESGSDSGDEPVPPGEDVEEDEPPPPGLEEGKEGDESAAEEEPSKEKEKEPEAMVEDKEEEEEKKTAEKSDDDAESVASDKEEREKSKKHGEEGDGVEEGMETEGSDKDREKTREKSEEPVAKPRPLHRTASIFLRNLAPTITKQEVEAMCKRYPGFLRVAIADPQPERRWFRRGWVTFERHVNIKEICWNLNNIRVSSRLRDCELGAIVNRDLSRRIRTVNGITSHRQVVRHDIKLSARIVHNLDSKCGLWQDENSTESKSEPPDDGKNGMDQDPIPSFGLVSNNPVLKNITDYLIEEASAEEEELLGHTADQEEGQVGDDSATVDRDEALIKVLDRLLLYLRIVHSVDYYNHCEYPNEDEMPNRCGIMHARGIPPSSKVTPQELSDYCRTFEQKIASFLQPATKISNEEFSKLGHKDPDVEVEKFIQANTQELAKDKWLCPLSGKKFKGPEFVRKHIFNKHAEKVEEVKKEVEYFNNYLRDPKRPQLPEHPGNRSSRKDSSSAGREEGFPAPAPYVPHYQYNYAAGRHANYGAHGFGGGYGYNQGYNQGYARPTRGGFSRGRGGGEYRPVIHYRDLDAPREPEEFI